MYHIRKITLFFLLACLVSPAFATGIKKEQYEGFKIDKKKPGNIEIIRINVLSPGGDLKIFSDADQNKPLDGTYHIVVHWREYIIGNFKKGIPHGDWEIYRHFRLSKKGVMQEGEYDGMVYTYDHDSGNVSTETLMENGVKRNYTSYYDDGTPWITYVYDEQGRKHGQFTVTDSNGELKKEESYDHGRLHGQQIEIDRTWNNKKISNYNHGVLTGEYTELYLNGNVRTKGQYDENGKKTGTWSSGEEDGLIRSEQNYLAGNLHGEQRIYFRGTDRLESAEEYADSKRHGRFVTYRENPYVVYSEGNYVNDKLHGAYKTYDQNGELWREQIYKEGQVICEKNYEKGRVRSVRLIDERGSLVNVEQYNSSGQRTYKNTGYKKPATIKLKESAGGVIDIEFD